MSGGIRLKSFDFFGRTFQAAMLPRVSCRTQTPQWKSAPSRVRPPSSPNEGRRLRPEPNRHFPPWVAGRFAPSILIYLDDSVRVRPSVRPSVLFPPSHPPFFPSISPQPLRRCPRDRASHAIRGRKNDPTPTDGRTDGRTVGWTAGERNMERSPEVRSSGRDRERGGDGGGKAGLSDGHQ